MQKVLIFSHQNWRRKNDKFPPKKSTLKNSDQLCKMWGAEWLELLWQLYLSKSLLRFQQPFRCLSGDPNLRTDLKSSSEVIQRHRWATGRKDQFSRQAASVLLWHLQCSQSTRVLWHKSYAFIKSRPAASTEQSSICQAAVQPEQLRVLIFWFPAKLFKFTLCSF